MSGIMVMSCAPQQKKLVYPETAKVDTVDVYFGTQVPDPYRWLENDTSAATTAWVEAQNKVTNEYLSQIPFRENLLKRLTTLADYEKISAPIKKHGKYYFSKNDGLQNLRTGFTGRRTSRFPRPEQPLGRWHSSTDRSLLLKRRQIYRLQYLTQRIGLV